MAALNDNLRRTLLLCLVLHCAAFIATQQSTVQLVERSSVLERLRGGADLIDASLLTNVGASILASSGALAFIAPGSNLAIYGLTSDESSQTMMRASGLWQLGAAAVLIAGKSGAVFASGFGLLSASLASLVNIAVFEVMGREKPSQVGGVVLLALLGKLTLDGVIGARVAAYVHLALGLLIHLTPVATAGLYQFTKPVSAVGTSMLALYGSTISLVGVYLAALAHDLTQPQSLACLFLTNGAFALKWALTDAKALGASTAGAVVWTMLSAALAGLALR